MFLDVRKSVGVRCRSLLPFCTGTETLDTMECHRVSLLSSTVLINQLSELKSA